MNKFQINTDKTFLVDSKQEWNETGIYLESGHRYTLEIIPREQQWIDGKRLKPFTADGRLVPHLLGLYPLLRMPSAKWFSLVGCIGTLPEKRFKIGSFREAFAPPASGQLICFANDVKGHYENNEGSLTLKVTRTQ